MPRIRLAAFLAVSLVAGPARAQTGRLPGPACKANGPCMLPDTKDLLAAKGSSLTIASNFGLLYPSNDGRGYQFICEEAIGGRISDTVQAAADGRVFVPANDGLYSSTDSCSWTRSGGDLGGKSVWDVAFDPSDPKRMWVVDGDPRELALSTDGGATFTTKQTFDVTQRFIRVLIAPSDPRVIYLAGYKVRNPLVLAVSTDGGQTFAIDETAAQGIADPVQVVALLGIAPNDPKTAYFVITNQMGDQIWKSTDGGKTLVNVLSMPDELQQYGFTFGADANTLYVGSRDPLETVGKPPAWLFVSHDGARTWEKRPSTDKGPRYRCVRYEDGKLYACGGDKINGDSFLLGTSADDGRTWTPVMTLTDLQGARSCVFDRCIATASWLCDGWGVCGGISRDGGASLAAPDAAVAGGGGGKKGCSFEPAGRPGVGTLALIAALLGLARRRRRKRDIG
jgi:MYXO-CTERM domain-containing protein